MYHIFTDIVRQTIEVPEMCQQKWGPHHQRWQGDTSRGGWTAQLYRGRVWIGARVWWRTAAATETTENSNCCEMDWQRIRGTEWVGLLCFVLALRHKKTGSSYMNHMTGTAQIWRKRSDIQTNCTIMKTSTEYWTFWLELLFFWQQNE